MKHIANQAQWIWTTETGQAVNQYVEFRCEFNVDSVDIAELCLSVDSNFVAWVNGQLVGTGQFSDFPEKKTFSRMDITHTLVPGKNVLAMLGHYCGQDNFSYIPGKPGLWFAIRCGNTEIVSDENAIRRIAPAYQQGSIARITPQLGFTFEYDARNQDNWITLEYQPGKSWASAVTVSGIGHPKERPLPMLSLKSRPAHKIIAQGLLKRSGSNDATVAQLMQQDFLSARHNYELFDNVAAGSEELTSRTVTIATGDLAGSDGAYVVVDLDREQCGFIDLELDTAAGTIIDIAVGEHLDDLRVRSSVGGRHFASRYITCAGRQRFTHFASRYAGRYVQLHFTNVTASLTLHYAGLIPCDYPLEMRGSFSCDDSLMNRIYEVSRHTLHMCMHELYEDCPWREQALYAEDARIESLIGYYAFGEYDFARVSLNIIGQSAREDGYLDLCAPAKFSVTIPFSTMAWLMTVEEHLRFSGNIGQAKMKLPQVRKMVDTHLGQLVDDLLPCPQDKKYWHFYDWADGLDGPFSTPNRGEGLTGQRFDAPLNGFFVFALQAAARICDTCDETSAAQIYKKQADATRAAFHKKFWDDSEKAYKTYVGSQAIENHYAEMTQAVALLGGIVPQDIAKQLVQKLAQPNNGMVAITLGASIYKFDAILSGAPDLAGQVFDEISRDWGKMLYSGATSFWETIKGQFDFSGGGSLCHGFSTTPAYVYQAYLLGIKPLEAGFASFQVNPLFSVVLSVSGTVPTPSGNIEVSWEKCGKSYVGRLVHPKNLKPLFVDSDIDCEWTVAAT